MEATFETGMDESLLPPVQVARQILDEGLDCLDGITGRGPGLRGLSALLRVHRSRPNIFFAASIGPAELLIPGFLRRPDGKCMATPARLPPDPQVIQVQINNGCCIQRQHLAEDQSTHNRDAQRAAQF